MSCIGFTNPRMREQIVSAEACAARLPYSPVRKVKRHRMESMATSTNVKIREAAASHPDLPRDLMFQLVKDPVASVRAWVARNYSAPVEFIRWLSHDEDPAIAAYAKWKLENLPRVA